MKVSAYARGVKGIGAWRRIYGESTSPFPAVTSPRPLSQPPMVSRRTFLATTGALLASGRAAHALTRSRTPAPMRVLVLGGTGFIGPHIVRELVARGHQVTIFTRGRRDAASPPASSA